MKAIYLLAFTVLIFGSCSRKWKQPTSCTFEMSYIDDNASAKNDVSAALYFTESIEFMGSREEAGDVFLSKSVNKQINGNSTETINFDLPQGTYSLLSTTLTLSRTSGASHSIRILGKHYFDDGSFSNFQFDIDNEVAITMAKCNKDTAGNRHVARRFHYVRQGIAQKEHEFSWIGTKFQQADPLTKPGSATSFVGIWSHQLHDCD